MQFSNDSQMSKTTIFFSEKDFKIGNLLNQCYEEIWIFRGCRSIYYCLLTWVKILLWQVLFSVVYFNELLGAAHTQKLVEILFSAVFNLFLFRLAFECTQQFSFIIYWREMISLAGRLTRPVHDNNTFRLDGFKASKKKVFLPMEHRSWNIGWYLPRLPPRPPTPHPPPPPPDFIWKFLVKLVLPWKQPKTYRCNFP